MLRVKKTQITPKLCFNIPAFLLRLKLIALNDRMGFNKASIKKQYLIK